MGWDRFSPVVANMPLSFPLLMHSFVAVRAKILFTFGTQAFQTDIINLFLAFLAGHDKRGRTSLICSEVVTLV
jgi:hypothetical protein